MSQIVNNFKDIPISNMVGVFSLDNKFNTYSLFRLCRLNSIGNITYISHAKHDRGHNKPNKKSKCKKCWKNSVCMLINGKISAKLSDYTLHITGLKSTQQAEDCFNYIKENLSQVEDDIKYMKNNIEMSKKCIEWIKSVTKGDEIHYVKN